MKICKQDVVLVNFIFEDNSNLSKRRPAVVLKDGTVLLLAAKVTSKVDKYHGFYDYSIKDWKYANLKQPSVVRLDKVVELPTTEVIKVIGHLSARDIENIEDITNL